ncbi:MAG: AAA family ATPase, partial [Acidimicrobiia bacterium]
MQMLRGRMMEPTPEWEMGPGLLESMWRYRVMVIVTVLVATLAGYGLSFLQDTMYEGRAEVILADPRKAGVFRDATRLVIDPSRYVRNQAERMVSSEVLLDAAQAVGIDLPLNELRELVNATPATNLDQITVTALDPTPEGAAALANAIVEAYQRDVTEEVQANAAAALAELDAQQQELQAQIDALDAQLDTDPDNAALQAQRDAAVTQIINLKARADQIAVDAALYGDGVELFERSEIPESPARPQPVRNAAVAAMLGLMGAGAFAWWRAENSQTADHRHDPAPILGAPLLGVIPELELVGSTGRIPAATNPNSPAGESYQFVASSIDYSLTDERKHVLLITSPAKADGKTVTTANLAVAMSRAGREILVVDADERARGLSEIVGANGRPGLTDLAHKETELTHCLVSWNAGGTAQLPLVPAGTRLDSQAAFFRTSEFRDAMRKIHDAADVILVDSPPLLAVADTSAIAGQADGIILVVTQGTPLSLLEEARDRLSFIGTPLLGYVFNRAQARSRRYAYGYGYGYGYGAYGYGYGYGESEDGQGERTKRERKRKKRKRD